MFSYTNKRIDKHYYVNQRKVLAQDDMAPNRKNSLSEYDLTAYFL